jgi:hypothetical protein
MAKEEKKAEEDRYGIGQVFGKEGFFIIDKEKDNKVISELEALEMMLNTMDKILKAL